MKILLLCVLLLLPATLGIEYTTEIHEIQAGTITYTYPKSVTTEEAFRINVEVNVQAPARIESLNFGSRTDLCALNPQTCVYESEDLTLDNVGKYLFSLVITDPTQNESDSENIDKNQAYYFGQALASGEDFFYEFGITVLLHQESTIQVEGTIRPDLSQLLQETTGEETTMILLNEERLKARDAVIVTKQRETYFETTEDGKVEPRTKYTISITPKEGKTVKEVKIFETISKEAAESYVDIVRSNEKFVVLDPDPLIMWQFATVPPEVQVSYEVDQITYEDGETVVTVGEVVEQSNILHIILPLLLIPLIGIIIVFFSKYRKR